MRILITTQAVDRNDPTLGFFHRWIIEFSKRFEKVTVICLRKGEYELPANVKVISLGKEEGIGRLTYLWRFYSALFKESCEYDSVFVHMNPEYMVLGGVFWRLMGKKAAIWYLHKSVDAKLRVALALCYKALTASKMSLRLQSPKIAIIGHGIDTDAFNPIEEEDAHESVTIMSVGRISPVKDYETLIKAFASLEIKEVILSIVGAPATTEDARYEASLKELAVNLGVAERIDFAGAVAHEDVPSLLQTADIFVNMSATGSIDKAVLEAMACGVPALTSNPAFWDMLAPYGLVFKEGDAESLRKALHGLIMKKGELRPLGFKLREIVVKDHGLSSLISKIKAELE